MLTFHFWATFGGRMSAPTLAKKVCSLGGRFGSTVISIRKFKKSAEKNEASPGVTRVSKHTTASGSN